MWRLQRSLTINAVTGCWGGASTPNSVLLALSWLWGQWCPIWHNLHESLSGIWETCFICLPVHTGTGTVSPASPAASFGRRCETPCETTHYWVGQMFGQELNIVPTRKTSRNNDVLYACWQTIKCCNDRDESPQVFFGFILVLEVTAIKP